MLSISYKVKHNSWLILLIILFLQTEYGYSQNLDVEGRAKISVMDLLNSVDNIVVRQADGTLAIRDASTISPFQILSLSNDTLYLTNGGFVVLPEDSTAGWGMNTDTIHTEKSVVVGNTTTDGKFEVFVDSTFILPTFNDQTSDATGDPLVISSGSYGAQSFIAGITGDLAAIEIQGKKQGASDAELNLQVRTGNDPAAGVILANYPFTIVSTSDSIYHIQLNPNIPVTANSDYVMIIDKTGGGDASWQRSATDVYPNGNAFINASGWLPPLTNKDHWFKTFAFETVIAPVSVVSVSEDRKIQLQQIEEDNSMDTVVVIKSDGTLAKKSATKLQDLSEVLSNGKSAGSSRISDLNDPVFSMDAVTKNYVNDKISSLVSLLASELSLTVQERLDFGESPLSIYNDGLPEDSLYGKFFEGGLIFYLDTLDQYDFEVMISAETDQSMNTIYGCPNVEIPGDQDWDIGLGFQNTLDILGTCSSSGIAADLCDDLISNGYDDWFLPSTDELTQMYLNLHDNGLGNFADEWYIGSAENDINEIVGVHFNGQANGSGQCNPKDYPGYVRAVRLY